MRISQQPGGVMSERLTTKGCKRSAARFLIISKKNSRQDLTKVNSNQLMLSYKLKLL